MIRRVPGFRSPVVCWCFRASVIFLLTSCTNSVVVDPGNSRTYVFECAGAYEFVARVNGDNAWLFLPGETLNLRSAPPDSGSTFVSDKASLRVQGEEASLDFGTISHPGCRNNRAKAIWEHAKLDGVDFRAVGNEPGWHLTITVGGAMVLVSDYGSSTWSFRTPAPETNQQQRNSRYMMQERGHEMTVLLEGVACNDSMSGDSFETTVTVNIDGTLLKGCGRALH